MTVFPVRGGATINPLVFTDGDLLFIARADDVSTLDEIRSDLGAP